MFKEFGVKEDTVVNYNGVFVFLLSDVVFHIAILIRIKNIAILFTVVNTVRK
jgi:hypothetical protein